MSSTSEGPDAPATTEPAASAAAFAPQIAERATSEADGPALGPSPPAAPKRGGLSILVLGFVAGVIGGVASGMTIGLLPVKLPGSPGADIASVKSALREADVPALRARLVEIEKRQAAGPAAAPDVADLRARLQVAEQQLNALAGQFATLSVSATPGTAPALGPDVRNMASGLATSFAELKGRVDTLSAEVQTAQNISARLAAIETRVPADLGAQLAALAAKGDLSALDQRLAKLEANTSAADAKRAAGTIVLANLVRTAQSGSPFTAELEAVRFLNADPALVAPLAAYAGQGVRPVAQLAESFGRVETAALRAAGRNWWDRLWAGLFVVKSAESKDGASVEAVLSRAKVAARTGNLQDALGELSRLSGPAADVVAGWRAQAEARLTLDSLVTKLSARILADSRG